MRRPAVWLVLSLVRPHHSCCQETEITTVVKGCSCQSAPSGQELLGDAKRPSCCCCQEQHSSCCQRQKLPEPPPPPQPTPPPAPPPTPAPHPPPSDKYDCEAGSWNWMRGWSEEKKDWCCEHRSVGCRSRSYDCRTDGDRGPEHWSASERFWCCQHEDVGCVGDAYDCDAGYSRWRTGWSDRKKRWCCEFKQKGCTKDTTSYDCEGKAPSETDRWPADQAKWCCQHWGVGCSAAASASASLSATTRGGGGFDCSDRSHSSLWPDVQKAWCCVSEGIECDQATTTKLFDCQAGLIKWETGWSKEKINWCCQHEGLGCRGSQSGGPRPAPTTSKPPPTPAPGPDLYNCNTPSAEWSVEKRDWCCEYREMGCSVTVTHTSRRRRRSNLAAPPPCVEGMELASTTHPPQVIMWCCENRGIACPASVPASGSSVNGGAVRVLVPPPSPTPAPAAPASGSAAGLLPTVLPPLLEGASASASSGSPKRAVEMAASAATASSGPPAATCWEEKIRYDPLDMIGKIMSQEDDVASCQARCKRTMGCTHFSYDTQNMECHVTDKNAVPHWADNFRSGPPDCKMKGAPCYEVNQIWGPYMQGKGATFSDTKNEMTAVEAAKACKNLCFNTEGCEHYIISFPGRVCNLAASGAVRSVGVHTVTGPPYCNRSRFDDLQAKFALESIERELRQEQGLLGLAAAAAGLLVLSFAALLLRHSSRAGTCRTMMAKGRRTSRQPDVWQYSSLAEVPSADWDDSAGMAFTLSGEE